MIGFGKITRAKKVWRSMQFTGKTLNDRPSQCNHIVGHVDNRNKFVCISNKPRLLLHLKAITT